MPYGYFLIHPRTFSANHNISLQRLIVWTFDKNNVTPVINTVNVQDHSKVFIIKTSAVAPLSEKLGVQIVVNHALGSAHKLSRSSVQKVSVSSTRKTLTNAANSQVFAVMEDVKIVSAVLVADAIKDMLLMNLKLDV